MFCLFCPPENEITCAGDSPSLLSVLSSKERDHVTWRFTQCFVCFVQQRTRSCDLEIHPVCCLFCPTKNKITCPGDSPSVLSVLSNKERDHVSWRFTQCVVCFVQQRTRSCDLDIHIEFCLFCPPENEINFLRETEEMMRVQHGLVPAGSHYSSDWPRPGSLQHLTGEYPWWDCGQIYISLNTFQGR